MVNERPWNVRHEIYSHPFLGYTGDELTGGAENSSAVIQTASTPDPVPFLVVPLPIEIFLPPGLPPIVLFSMLTTEFVLLTIPCDLLLAPGPHTRSSILSAPPPAWTPHQGGVKSHVGLIRVNKGKRKRMASPYDGRLFQRSHSDAKHRYW